VLTAAATLRTPHRVATYRTLIGLLVTTGMRVGEAIGLDRSDVDAPTLQRFPELTWVCSAKVDHPTCGMRTACADAQEAPVLHLSWLVRSRPTCRGSSTNVATAFSSLPSRLLSCDFRTTRRGTKFCDMSGAPTSSAGVLLRSTRGMRCRHAADAGSRKAKCRVPPTEGLPRRDFEHAAACAADAPKPERAGNKRNVALELFRYVNCFGQWHQLKRSARGGSTD
jgi:hypothetical protein